ncbi:hypothetical protein BK659_00815 [Pseudomonas brassicacearum]|uniref:DUF1453 domain-containing protein n=1 Tax=Pseudomonas brassicacearum TaxID=930166 RepID=A0A423HDW7_9PSED|nr:DUF6622 family protein [Pseudomonas brassicacearum]RON11376.1 hypothetical protein BK659_00815 [Pseudomonas brassicacearum]
MLDILRGTPLWVYAVFFILTYYGVSACFKSHESKRSLQITPAIFVVISLVSLKFSQGAAIPLSVYALGLLAGWILALRFYSYQSVERDGQRLVLGGTVKVLIVYWGFFAWRYYSGYQAAMHPELADEVSAVAWSALGAGIINGLIVGRSFRLLRFFKSDNEATAPSKPQ